MHKEQEILISQTSGETRVAICVHGRVQELRIQQQAQNEDAGIRAGDIYRGRITRVVPGMQAAFVELGEARNGFLPRANIAAGQPNDGIASLLHEGQVILVQVQRAPRGDKGALLSTELSLAGRLLVYLPAGDSIAIANSITDPAERRRLHVLVADQSPDGGMIIRSAAVGADAQALAREGDWLRAQWHSVASTPAVGGRVYAAGDIIETLLRDVDPDNVEKVVFDQTAGLLAAQKTAMDLAPQLHDKMHLHEGNRPLFDQHRIEEEFAQTLQRTVELENGATLVFDQTEAMTTVDVNSAGHLGRADQDQTLFDTNLAAASELARQLRLRNLAGLIVVDFIDMRDAGHRQHLQEALREELVDDPRCGRPSPLSALGIIEFSRRREGPSMLEARCEPCPVCTGSGYIKTAQSICYDILRDLEASHKTFTPASYTVVAAPTVVALLSAEYLEKLQASLGRPVVLHADENHISQYEIALG